MSMIEDLKNLFSHHAEDLKERFDLIAQRLSDVELNTRTEENLDVFAIKTDTGEAEGEEGKAVAEVQLVPKRGIVWKVIQAAVTQSSGGSVAIYLNSVAATNLLAVLGPGTTGEKQHFYVPRGSTLIFHFFEQKKGQSCTATVQVEQLHKTPERASRQAGDEAPMI